MHENVKKDIAQGGTLCHVTQGTYLMQLLTLTYSSIHYKCTYYYLCPRLFDIITVSEDDHVACRCYAPQEDHQHQTHTRKVLNELLAPTGPLPPLYVSAAHSLLFFRISKVNCHQSHEKGRGKRALPNLFYTHRSLFKTPVFFFYFLAHSRKKIILSSNFNICNKKSLFINT